MRYNFLHLCSSPQSLQYYFRYNTQNVLICGLTPGPTELTGDELQVGVLKAFIDDLIRLYEGVIVKTPKYTEGKKILTISFIRVLI